MAWTGRRFCFTGQVVLPDVQLYHSKARVYDAVLGHFLQTDPIGYEDDLNLYAYARNDPLMLADAGGRRTTVRGGNIEIRPEGNKGPAVTIRNTVGASGFRPGLLTHQYEVRTPTGLRGGDNLSSLGSSLRSNPTPGRDTPASPEGSRNNVGQLGSGLGSTNFVRSFSVDSPDPKRYSDIVVNYTISGEHSGEEGFVMRFAEMGKDGSIDMVSVGEGDALAQMQLLEPIWGPIIDNVWQQNQQQIIDECEGCQR